MFSLSVFARLKKLEFIYVTDHINNFLINNLSGNLAFSLKNGMKIYEYKDKIELAISLKKTHDLFIPEGIAMKEAELGFSIQANEISEFASKNNLKFDIFLPSGTGTSATYLAKNSEFEVFTVPCVGDCDYLKRQIHNLDKNVRINILKPPKKYHFGDLKLELFNIYKELKLDTKIEFDLLYDPIGWISLLTNLDRFKNDILYIHQGGIIGNETMLARYNRKFNV